MIRSHAEMENASPMTPLVMGKWQATRFMYVTEHLYARI